MSDYFARSVRQPPAEPRGTVLEQEGTLRLSPNKPWMPFTAEQNLKATEPGFVWHARFKMAPFITGVVEDALESGKGRLDAKIWGVLPVAHGRGIDIDRGEAQRYLAELVWCPMAFLYNPDLEFRVLSESVVRVWLGNEDVYVDWRFNRDGDLVGAKTETRTRDGVVQPWEGRFDEFKDFGDFRAPAFAEVWWDAPEGRFVYWQGSVTSLAWDV